MKRKIKTVAVYCGHEFGLNPAFARDAGLMGAGDEVDWLFMK